MHFYKYNTANLIKLLLIISIFFFFVQICFSQEESTDPINKSLNGKKQIFEGVKFSKREFEKLQKIEEKYSLTQKEKELQKKHYSGYKLNFRDNLKLNKSYRKNHLKKKK